MCFPAVVYKIETIKSQQANKEEKATKQKAHYDANKEAINAHRKALRDANKEAINAKRKAKYNENKLISEKL